MIRFCFRLFILFMVGVTPIWAQSTKGTVKKKEAVDVVEELKRQGIPGCGVVTINQSPKLQYLIDKKITEAEEKPFIVFTGYRIQVYMGNNQKKSKSEALKREEMIKEKYPDLPAYLSFVSPFWRLRIGDFRTHTEALVSMRELLTDFPEFKGQVYVVKDDETRDLLLEEN